jgi:hypothetical protein
MDEEIYIAWNKLTYAGVLDYFDAVDLAHKYYDRHPECTSTDIENLFGSSVEESVVFERMAYGKRAAYPRCGVCGLAIINQQ